MINLTKNHLVAFSVLALLLIAGAYGVLVWPTPYIIVHEKGEVFRVNRFTGIRQKSTETGWMTDAQIRQQAKAKVEAREGEDRIKSEQILAELKTGLKVDDDRSNAYKLALYNPTDWQLSHGLKYSGDGDTVVEYYRLEKGKEIFLAKNQVENFFIKPRMHNDFRLYDVMALAGSPSKLPPEVSDLPEGTRFVQKVTITFGAASNTTGDRIQLQPAFVFTTDRDWVAASPQPLDLIDWLVREKQRKQSDLEDQRYITHPETSPK